MLGACGSSTPSPTTTTVAKPPSAISSITTNWKAFFNGTTPASRKVALLQNGSSFAAIIDGQASSALAKSVRATVSKVSDVTASSANVRYSISLSGTTALANQTGAAVKQSGTWKVSDASFCVLLGLEGVKTPACSTS